MPPAAGWRYAAPRPPPIAVASGGGASGDAAIVDLDRARLRPGTLGARLRTRSLRRLLRSLAKLDPAGTIVDADVRRRFHDAYARTLERACAS